MAARFITTHSHRYASLRRRDVVIGSLNFPFGKRQNPIPKYSTDSPLIPDDGPHNVQRRLQPPNNVVSSECVLSRGVVSMLFNET